MNYTVDANGTATACLDLLTWARWFETANRHVGRDTIGDADVSTVFLGTDHAWNGGPPVLWETMVFGGALDGECVRYTSHADAVAGHAAMVARVAS